MNLQFQAMDEYDQFVLISRTHVVSKRGKPCDPYDPANHLSGSVAQRIARRKGYVRGFAIMRSDPFFVIHVENYRRSAQDLAEIGPRFPEVLIRRSAGSACRGAAIITESHSGSSLLLDSNHFLRAGFSPAPPFFQWA